MSSFNKIKTFINFKEILDIASYLKADKKLLIYHFLFSSLIGLLLFYILPPDFITNLLEFIKIPEGEMSVSHCSPEVEKIVNLEAVSDSSEPNSNKWTWKGYVAVGLLLCLFFGYMGEGGDLGPYTALHGGSFDRATPAERAVYGLPPLPRRWF